MSIKIEPPLETELRIRAKAEGITVEAYLDRLLRSEKQALGEIEELAMEGLDSGGALECDAGYWESLHHRADERAKRRS